MQLHVLTRGVHQRQRLRSEAALFAGSSESTVPSAASHPAANGTTASPSIPSKSRSGAGRITMSYMKTSALTIRIDRQLERQLDSVAKQTGRSRSDIARDALRRRLAVLQFDEARRQVMPFAEAEGYLTDEDVFKDEP